MELLSDLISSFDSANPNFRPTELYNESWLIKLVFHQAANIEDLTFPIGFLPGSTWFSEALLPTAFKARFRGDPLSESRTRADGVIGHILVGAKAKADLELQPRATHFSVVEAKIGSTLSPRINHADYYDQAARNVACMAEAMARADIHPSTMNKLEFVVLAPQYSIGKGIFKNELQPQSILSKVKRRVSGYEGHLDDWYTDHFEPTMDQIQIHSLSWEDAISWIGKRKPEAAGQLAEFYRLCLKFS